MAAALLYNLPMLTPQEAQEKIQEMVRRIVDQFRPHKNYLFGSRARGDERPDSDVDLLVVKPFDGSKRELRIQMRLAVSGMGLAKDILLVSPEEFAALRTIAGTIVRNALREGKVLYDQAA